MRFLLTLFFLTSVLVAHAGTQVPPTPLSQARTIKETNEGDIFCHLDYIRLMLEEGKGKKVRFEYRDRWREKPEDSTALFIYLFTLKEKAWKEYLIARLANEHPQSALGPIAKAQQMYPSLTTDFRFYDTHEEYQEALKKCRKLLDEALKKENNLALAHYVSGQLAQAEGDQDKAKEALARAYALFPQNSAIAYQWGVTCTKGDNTLQFTQGFKRQEALKALRLAKESNRGWLEVGADVLCLLALANTLAHNDEGHWNGQGADLQSAEECYLLAAKKQNASQTRIELLKHYCLRKEFDKGWQILANNKDVSEYERKNIFASWALNRGNSTFKKEGHKLTISLKRIPWDSGYFWLVGDFNNWQMGLTPFVEKEDGYSATITVNAGTYRYAFVSEKSNARYYDASAPTFVNKLSAFKINKKGEVEKARSSYQYHLARASYAISSFDSLTLLEEAAHALQYEPNSSEALSYLCGLTEGAFRPQWLALRPIAFTAAHEGYLTVSSGRAQEKERALLLARARAGGIKGPTLISNEAYAEQEPTVRQDKLLAAIRAYPLSESLVSTYSRLCTGPAATDALFEVVKDKPQNNLVLRYAALVAQNHSRDKAVSVLRKYISPLEKDGSSCWQTIISYAEDPKAKKLDVEKIVPLLEEGLKAFPHDRWLHSRYRSYLGSEKQNSQKAITFLEELQKNCDESPAITASLAWFHSILGRDDLALKMYEEAQRSCPGWYWLLLRYGELLKDERKFATALTIFKRAYRLRTQDAYPATMAATIYSIQGKEKERIALLEKALLNTHYAEQQSFLRMKLARYYQFRAGHHKRALALSLAELHYLESEGKKTEATAGFVAQAALSANKPMEFIKATKHYDGSILMALMIVLGIGFTGGAVGILMLILWYALRKVPLIVSILGTLFVLYAQIGAQTLVMFAAGYGLHGKFLSFMDVTSSTVGPMLLQISGVPAMLAGLIAILVIFYRRAEGPKKLGLTWLPTAKQLFVGLFFGFALFAMQKVVSSTMIYLLGQMPSGIFGVQDEPYAARLMHLSTVGLILTTVNVVFFAPLFEELFFRAYVYRLWKEHMGYGKGVVLSCLVFALLHFQGLIHLFLVAYVLCKLYDYTESLWPPMLAHGVMNAIVLVVGYLHAY